MGSYIPHPSRYVDIDYLNFLQDRVSYSSLDALSKTIECEPFNKPEVGMYFTILYIN